MIPKIACMAKTAPALQNSDQVEYYGPNNLPDDRSGNFAEHKYCSVRLICVKLERPAFALQDYRKRQAQ
jgi:hypothetical protein